MSDWRDAPLVDPAQIESYREMLSPEQVSGLVAAFGRELATRPAEIAMLLNQYDYTATRIAAHRLRGAALAIGACRIAALADALETGPTRSLASLTEALAICAHETNAALAG